MRDLADRRGEHRRDAGVHRVAALLQDADAGGDRVVPSGGDDAVRPEDLGSHRVGARVAARAGSCDTLLRADGHASPPMTAAAIRQPRGAMRNLIAADCIECWDS